MIQQPYPDMAESGRVLATLDDWRALLFVAVLIIIAILTDSFLRSSAIRKERQDMTKERERMWEVADKFGVAADTIGDQMHKITTELEVTRALNARMESIIVRAETRERD